MSGTLLSRVDSFARTENGKTRASTITIRSSETNSPARTPRRLLSTAVIPETNVEAVAEVEDVGCFLDVDIEWRLATRAR
ncbi:hypothetical protein BRC68_12340 [Halobacteriales archaeon QH_6_64_20]|nr:MAG: hypothetical protein BRC68_12340 [Halobacteriales archaeon QH_6_64_20]